ncbi:hypothetical protein TRFO_31046 [Tritrichomonas foetus]|uniref:sn-1-specific diacylglycerol lipase n=1 Tax=Tritrichomonas foetus TaxID=1144522 RepID=A0A1J4JWR0_9EUKA|nr:hypothetical protein TRFO_31046 [Tritrichomonas foetus]|eukprot:OHT01972.1 hypothetical protein TRFO_31046 [Tritrichomonas foetus]
MGVGLQFYALLQLVVRLAESAYNNDFDKYPGQVLYSNLVCEKMKPIFYIYTQDGALFVAIRGSQDNEDFATDTMFTETKTEHREFIHSGFYGAAQFVFETVKQYTKGFTGPIYFTGHSYGAAVSQVMHVMQYHEDPTLDVTSFAFAPVPSMNLEADDEIRDKMYAFVNDDDIIPTLSIPNCYKRFTFLFPTLHDIPSDTIIDKVNSLLKIIKFTSILDSGLFNMIWDSVPIIVNAAKQYEQGEPKYVRYVSGTAYQLVEGKPKTLSKAKINQEIFLDTLSVTFSCLSDHNKENYVKIIDQIIEE